MQGAPGIYYGTEIGMDGGGTKANRKCMPWEEIDAGSFAELTGQVKRLIAMRRQYPQTRSGNVMWDVREVPDCYIIIRKRRTKNAGGLH